MSNRKMITAAVVTGELLFLGLLLAFAMRIPSFLTPINPGGTHLPVPEATVAEPTETESVETVQESTEGDVPQAPTEAPTEMPTEMPTLPDAPSVGENDTEWI